MEDKRTEKMIIGDRGEDAAAAYLTRKGYRILARKFRCKTGEIDIIALDGRFLVFAEVKTRTNLAYGMPKESVQYRKQTKLIRTAYYYRRLHAELRSLSMRMDVVEVLTDGSGVYVRHIVNAFSQDR